MVLSADTPRYVGFRTEMVGGGIEWVAIKYLHPDSRSLLRALPISSEVNLGAHFDPAQIDGRAIFGPIVFILLKGGLASVYTRQPYV